MKQNFAMTDVAHGTIADNCCSKGVRQYKCPYICKNLTTNCVPYLYCDNDNQRHVNESHPYHYQIQGQMHVCSFSPLSNPGTPTDERISLIGQLSVLGMFKKR